MVSQRNNKAKQGDEHGVRRTGLTLSELLVVIAILVVVTSVLAPLISPSLEGREIREAARQINAYMQQAQAKARELGRPVGVVIQRNEFIGDPNDIEDATGARLDFGYQLSLAEEPPPFKGFVPTDRAQIRGADAFLQLLGTAVGGIDPAVFKLIQPNDHIRFNLRGPKFRITDVSRVVSDADMTQFPQASIKVRFDPLPVGGAISNLNRLQLKPIPFEVFRRPRQTVSTPMELPNGTALIMDLSGVGMDYYAMGPTNTGEETQRNETFGGGSNPRHRYIGLTEFKRPTGAEMMVADPSGSFLNHPLTIMFAPDGSVDRVYRVLPPLAPNPEFRKYPPKRPQDKIFLFIGRDAKWTWENFKDPANLWIAIDPINGLVNTAPNIVEVPDTFDNLTMPEKLARIATARQIAATGQSVGGQ